MIEFIPRSMHHSELYVTQYGKENCAPGHFYGPAVRDYYLLHYIMDGCGMFRTGGKTYHLNKGEGFLIHPHIVTYYEADTKSPWSYCWIGFDGLIAEHLLNKAGLYEDRPVFVYNHDDTIQSYILSMTKSKSFDKSRQEYLTGKLYMLMAALIENSPSGEEDRRNMHSNQYADQVIRFIEMNYADKITVEDIAASIGLNRSYLNAMFKRITNVSIQQYLIHFRLRRACELMTNEQLSIGDIARSVGYTDPLLFSKIFKKYKGLSPVQYRKQSMRREG